MPGTTVFDTTVPDQARVRNYLLGGKDNYAADRAAGEALTDPATGHPGIRHLARESRVFIVGDGHRDGAVQWLARNKGIAQFVDVGCGLPAGPTVGSAARSVISAAAVCYVDGDPVVMAHIRALEARGPGLAAVEADVTDPAVVLADPALREVIDLAAPVCVVLGGTLSRMPPETARAVVAGFAEALVPGSAVVISCASFDDEGVAGRIAAVFGGPGSWRSHGPEDVASFFAGLRLVRGAVGDVRCWPMLPPGGGRTARVLGGVGIKQ